jgi:hypothetical protein
MESVAKLIFVTYRNKKILVAASHFALTKIVELTDNKNEKNYSKMQIFYTIILYLRAEDFSLGLKVNQMSETQFFFFFMGVIIIMVTATSYLIYKSLLYHATQLQIILTPTQKRKLKWAISSIVTILTGHFCLLHSFLFR